MLGLALPLPTEVGGEGAGAPPLLDGVGEGVAGPGPNGELAELRAVGVPAGVAEGEPLKEPLSEEPSGDMLGENLAGILLRTFVPAGRAILNAACQGEIARQSASRGEQPTLSLSLQAELHGYCSHIVYAAVSLNQPG